MGIAAGTDMLALAQQKIIIEYWPNKLDPIADLT
jgi:hypothetical protein